MTITSTTHGTDMRIALLAASALPCLVESFVPPGVSAQVAEIRSVQIQLRRDSASDVMVTPLSLDLPSQRPWQNSFFVVLSVRSDGGQDLAGFDVQVGFDLKMGPQIFGGPDGEVLLKRKVDSLGAWF